MFGCRKESWKRAARAYRIDIQIQFNVATGDLFNTLLSLQFNALGIKW
ncbi:hypothetical protein COLO4_34213 [Corchorus olitorius]|uniref:Uncharacterized protein n=1 Tax=Corchorus olitorius TaxID=93759 RepID=A0A1R3GN38_9ROSI|nr:hypothetical protein COLO4_34213 [Corchorus olitorius]